MVKKLLTMLGLAFFVNWFIQLRRGSCKKKWFLLQRIIFM